MPALTVVRCITSHEAGAVIEYLAAKYLDNDDARKARTLAKVEKLLPELMTLVASMKEAA